MRIAIFGATGRTGRHLVDQGLAAGHELWALARNPSKLSAGHQRLTIVPGDILDGTPVEETVAFSEAVLCAIGTAPTRPGTAMSEGTRTIVDAMARSGVRRLVIVSAFGVGDSRRLLPLATRLVLPFVRRFMAEKERQEGIVRASGLDWIIVRPGQLVEAPASGRYETAPDPRKARKTVPYPDLAAFMLQQVGDDTWLHRTPGLFSAR